MTDPIEFIEERSAILEFCAGKPRTAAESLALREVVARYGQEAGHEAHAHIVKRRTQEGRA